jgi:hypothetical protein
MKNLLKFSLFLMGMTILTGCPPANTTTTSTNSAVQASSSDNGTEQFIPWTRATAQKYHVTSTDLQQIQFYSQGGQITLDYDTVTNSKHVENGVLLLQNFPVVNQVLVNEKTPGVMVSNVNINEDRNKSPRLYIKFENGGVNRYLPFVLSTDGRYYFALDQTGSKLIIPYDNQTYTASKSCQSVYLAVRIDEKGDVKTHPRVAEGVVIGVPGDTNPAK